MGQGYGYLSIWGLSSDNSVRMWPLKPLFGAACVCVCVCMCSGVCVSSVRVPDNMTLPWIGTASPGYLHRHMTTNGYAASTEDQSITLTALSHANSKWFGKATAMSLCRYHCTSCCILVHRILVLLWRQNPSLPLLVHGSYLNILMLQMQD